MWNAMGAGGAEKVSRRDTLRRFGKFGLLATAASGMWELVGASGASAKAPLSGVPVLISGGAASPDSCKCTGHLAKGHCNGPCPTGFYCYEVDYCGGATAKYACINCEGTSTCSYDCS